MQQKYAGRHEKMKEEKIMKITKRLKRMVLAVMTLVMVTGSLPEMTAIKANASQIQTADEVPIENATKEVTDGTVFDAEAEGYATGLIEDDMEATEAEATPANYASKMRVMSIAEDEALPQSVDNTQPMGPNNRTYFPKIGNQERIGSCWAWAKVYYQTTYAVNRYYDREVSEENTMSPKYNYWLYSALNMNYYGPEAVGALSVKDFPLEHFSNITDMLEYPMDVKATEEMQLKALQNKIEYEQVNREDIDGIKAILADGDLLYCESSSRWLYKKVPTGYPHAYEYIIAAELVDNTTGHGMTIVGYDDNVVCDLDGDGSISLDEKGAFKIANSWGRGWGNNGFIWVSYDAFREESNVKLTSTQKRSLPQVWKVVYNGPYTPDYYAVTTLETADVSSMCLEADCVIGKHSYAITSIRAGEELKNINFSGTTGKEEATFVFDMLSYKEYPIEEELDPLWEQQAFEIFSFYTGDTTIKDVRFVDSKEGETYGSNIEESYYAPNGTTYVKAKIDKTKFEITSLTASKAPEKTTAGEEITISALAEGADDIEYQFVYQDNFGEKIIRDYSSEPTCTWTAKYSYFTPNIVVNAKNTETGKIVSDSISFKVNQEVSVTGSTITSGDMELGESKQILISGNGGTGTLNRVVEVSYNGGEKTVYYSGPVKTDLYWAPDKAGEYKFWLSVEDENGCKDTLEAIINVTKFGKETVIYYGNSSWSGANIHYKVGDGNWTEVPGVQMTDSTEQSGYQWKYVIDLGEEDNATICFNDGHGTWDSRNGENYIVAEGMYGIKDGAVNQLTEVPIESPTNEQMATIYYNTGWSDAYIHYCIEGGSWTEVPGVAMTKTSEKSGYTHKIVLDLGTAESVTVCFNNGSGSWDSKEGNNYTIKAGTYGVSNGSVSEVK